MDFIWSGFTFSHFVFLVFILKGKKKSCRLPTAHVTYQRKCYALTRKVSVNTLTFSDIIAVLFFALRALNKFKFLNKNILKENPNFEFRCVL